MQRDDRGVLLLAAEAAAGLRLDHDRQLVAHVQRALHGLVDVVRALQRAVDRHATILARHGDHRLVLDVQLLLVADAVRALDDEGGFGHRRGRVTGLHGVVRELVIRCERVEHRGQRLGPEPQVPLRLPQRRPVGRRDEGAGLGLVTDLAADRHEDRLIGVDEADDVLAGDVVGGDHHDALPVERLVELDADETSPRLGGADRRAEPGAGDDEVVGVQRCAGELLGPLATERRRGRGASGRGSIGGDDERAGIRRRDAGQGACRQGRALHGGIVARPGAPTASVDGEEQLLAAEDRPGAGATVGALLPRLVQRAEDRDAR